MFSHGFALSVLQPDSSGRCNLLKISLNFIMSFCCCCPSSSSTYLIRLSSFPPLFRNCHFFSLLFVLCFDRETSLQKIAYVTYNECKFIGNFLHFHISLSKLCLSLCRPRAPTHTHTHRNSIWVFFHLFIAIHCMPYYTVYGKSLTANCSIVVRRRCHHPIPNSLCHRPLANVYSKILLLFQLE